MSRRQSHLTKTQEVLALAKTNSQELEAMTEVFSEDEKNTPLPEEAEVPEKEEDRTQRARLRQAIRRVQVQLANKAV